MARSDVKRTLLFLCIAVIFSLAWVNYRQIPLRVIGQPATTGLIQSAQEVPFFRGLRAATGIPLVVTYQALDEVGFKDTYQLSMLKNGLFDLVSLRFIQNSQIEPSLQGIDLVGLVDDYATARKVVRAYSGTVDRYLHDTFDAKLLGIWTFGPQVIFCRPPIRGLSDLRGLKVRVASQTMSTLISALGGTPAIIPFDETRNALAIGLVDCAVTSAASANFAGWTAQTRYYFPLALHFGLNGYAISLKKWNEFSNQEQRRLQAAFDEYLEALWTFSEMTHQDASSCIIGQTCQWGIPDDMMLVEPVQPDRQRLRNLMMSTLLPEWSETCEQRHPGCRQEWIDKVLAITQ